ncbi:LacI family DNA-binding transcriptional regulator [Sutcliffiella rhizosphaerae]|uniref:Catabolite control protein A n=1 Tax=Sutcliffiella rhizosphaerae TaxID=2880967 RepID=A0ABM8YMV2_9BACI|nr:LacI family DNA-binding transcriptional regulator [Sutcliffiella rhizosphaerae]CAG9621191.1 Catabolite control protein A [Sutcliffiella rhizosphaerae]
MKKKPTIEDVAKAANVSVATVSRVVNRQGGVRKATEERIVRAIDELNYVRSAIARSMVRKETKTIGVIIPDFTNPFFSEVISGLQKSALGQNYFTLISSSNESKMIESEIIQHYIERGVDGLVVTTADEKGDHLDPVIKAGIPIVAVDRQLKNYEVDTVLTGNREGAYEAVKHLISRGHTDIAIIRGPQGTTPGLERYRGFERAMKEYDLPIREEWIGEGDFMEGSGFACAKRFYEASKRPTAIFSSNNKMSIGAVKALQHLNWKIAEEIAFVGFDDIEIATFIKPNLTMVSRHMRNLGEIAFQLLHDRMKNNQEVSTVKRQHILSPFLIVRDSCQKFY